MPNIFEFEKKSNTKYGAKIYTLNKKKIIPIIPSLKMIFKMKRNQI